MDEKQTSDFFSNQTSRLISCNNTGTFHFKRTESALSQNQGQQENVLLPLIFQNTIKTANNSDFKTFHKKIDSFSQNEVFNSFGLVRVQKFYPEKSTFVEFLHSIIKNFL